MAERNKNADGQHQRVPVSRCRRMVDESADTGMLVEDKISAQNLSTSYSNPPVDIGLH